MIKVPNYQILVEIIKDIYDEKVHVETASSVVQLIVNELGSHESSRLVVKLATQIFFLEAVIAELEPNTDIVSKKMKEKFNYYNTKLDSIVDAHPDLTKEELKEKVMTYILYKTLPLN